MIRRLAVPACLVAAVALVVGDLLFARDGTVASHRVGDVLRSFVYLREFGMSELAQGNLALWNPHLFSGTPFVGSMQAAVLYPPNWIHLLLATGPAINAEIFFHLIVLAIGAYGFARGTGQSELAAGLTALVATFGATVSLRVLAGALTVLATYAWVPWLLRAVDVLARRASLGWTLAAIGATAMSLLAGHLPTALMSAFAVGVYALTRLSACPTRGRFVGALCGVVVAGAAIASVQLLLGYEAAAESIREAGVDFDFATSFSFPPESLVTWFMPSLFGDSSAERAFYYGRWFYWDDNAFVGASAFCLAAVGASQWRRAETRRALGLCVLFTVLALGRYTPVYWIAFELLPGFDLFRAPSKFMFFATLFLAVLAGQGLDRLRAPGFRGVGWAALAAVASLGGLCLIVGLSLKGAAVAGSEPAPLLSWLAGLNERATHEPDDFVQWAALGAVPAIRAGVTLFVIAGLLWAAPAWRPAVWGLVLIAAFELLLFARLHRGGMPFDYAAASRGAAAGVFGSLGEGRTLEVGVASNFPLGERGYSVWGYDPIVLDRYSAFMAHTQGQTAASLDNVAGEPPGRAHPLLRMVRLRALLVPSDTPGEKRIERVARGLPRFVLVPGVEVVPDREAALAAMSAPGFDPLATVVLESEPAVAPSGRAGSGAITILEESTDHVLVDVQTTEPAVLLMTDAYARGWRARALRAGAEADLQLLPANAALRGIPLAAGAHRVRIEYAPAVYWVGAAISGLSSLAFVCAVAVWAQRRWSA